MLDRAGAQSIWSLMDAIRVEARARGHVVHTLRWDDGGSGQEDRLVLGDLDHRIEIPRKMRPWDTLVQHRHFARSFTPFLKQLQPDILHCNFIVPGGLGSILARRAGVRRIVVTRHELAGSLSPHLRLWSHLTSRLADHRVHVSKNVARSFGRTEAVNYTGGAASQDLVIMNGVDRHALERVQGYPRPQGVRVLAVAGRMVAVKGHARALEAFSLAVRRDPSLRLELIGDGPERASLEARAQSLGVMESVEFTGWLPRDETMARVKSAWKVVVPSIQEGFGLVLAEAMSLNGDVIASDIAVFREVSSRGAGVLLVDCDDASALSTALLQAPNGETRLNPGELDQETMAKAYVDLYEVGRAR